MRLVNAPNQRAKTPRKRSILNYQSQVRGIQLEFVVGLFRPIKSKPRENIMFQRIVATAFVVGLIGQASAVELNPAAITIKQADDLKWRDPTGAAPINQKVLFGDPTKPGYYMVMNRFKPGNLSKPHFHPNDRFITVVKGTWYVGTGNKWDKDATVPVKAGGAVTHFGKQVHYDGAKDEEVILIITGEGPATLTPVDMAP